MKLTKIIAAHKKTVEFTLCKEFMLFSVFDKGRKRIKKKMVDCFWCGYAFRDEDMVYIAVAVKGGNKILCEKCATELNGAKP